MYVYVCLRQFFCSGGGVFLPRGGDLRGDLLLAPAPPQRGSHPTYLQSPRQVYTGLGHVCYLQGNDSLAEVRTYMTARILLNIYTYSTYMTL